MRLLPLIGAAGAMLIPSLAVAVDYHPWSGGLISQGYKESIEKDGSWRIVAEYSNSDPIDALDVALYRAADLARAEGKKYVQILGGSASSRMRTATAIIFATASDSPAAPAGCHRSKRCYTADVATVLDILGGENGRAPGNARVTSYDKYGRPVRSSGFGTGAIAWTS
jgi:hypothetical protein